MPHELPEWKIGDAYYALFVDPDTGRYVVRGIGRVVAVDGAYLHLATKSGPKRVGRTEWPAFRSREDAEAYVSEKPGPNLGRTPMAHH